MPIALFWKNPYTGRNAGRCFGRCSAEDLPTPRAALAHAACGVGQHDVRRWPSQHADFSFKTCAIYLCDADVVYFLDVSHRKISLQQADIHWKFDLSDFFPSWVQKCHRTKNRPSNRIRMRRMLTQVPYFLPDFLRIPRKSLIFAHTLLTYTEVSYVSTEHKDTKAQRQ